LRIVGQCIAAGASKPVSSTSATLMPCSGGPAQAFSVLTGGRVRNTATGLCLTVRNGRTAAGTTVLLTRCGTGLAQRWRLPG
jgi:hypothetical protein